MAMIIDGKAQAAALRQRLAEEAAAFAGAAGRAPRLDVILVGSHPASLSYVRTKARMAAETGMDSRRHDLPATVGVAEILQLIDRLNADDEVDGILVQLPLPDGIETSRVLERIDPAKDVDGFHPLNMGRLLAASAPSGEGMLVPCTPLGCLLLLQATLGVAGLRGRRALVVGRSNIVGKPMAALLLGGDCTVTLAHSRTRDLPAECRRAEILVAAIGKPQMIRGDWISPGAVVIDVGINRVTDRHGNARLVGDVAFDEAAPHVQAITPVPGGVGPMTVACLLRNTLTAAYRRRPGAA
ncbi:MAG TPA: bifunctional methylenetetrahydrofolate dehydrogenase/methenyltetrahydrofolate cyclohydrolase FolD [Geminicoccaceae bacterium]|nr:bifunctional methylenetetrahydrofolate dehydrogenase/methenyltetrahydrofolate cyclohydrolase FolD [Geminicoccus sp.]HMU48654.1 bifunctional methylenetetrahydrofolate dehydrogenase/methenyltetrahydrofolate cyclohydrolase FolD [Geminicoccaceae bacterium]